MPHAAAEVWSRKGAARCTLHAAQGNRSDAAEVRGRKRVWDLEGTVRDEGLQVVCCSHQLAASRRQDAGLLLARSAAQSPELRSSARHGSGHSGEALLHKTKLAKQTRSWRELGTQGFSAANLQAGWRLYAIAFLVSQRLYA